MFVVEILIYVLFAYVMFSLAKKSVAYNEDYCEAPDKFDKYIWWYMIFFAVISAIRWNVGGDSLSYITIFKKGVIIDETKETLWNWFVAFIHDYGIHFAFGLGICAFLQIFFLTDSFVKYRYMLVWMPIVLFGGRYFMDLMNGVRQMMVVCGFVFLCRYIINRKLIYYVVGVFILSMVHQTALFLLPFYAFAYVPWNKINLPDRKVLCLIILGVCVIIGQIGSFIGLVDYVDPFSETIGYDQYSSRAQEILLGKAKEDLSFGPMMISYLLVAVLIIWYAPILKKRYGEEIPEFNLWYFFSFLFACSYFVVCNLSHLIIRFSQYFEFFQLAMLSLLLNYFYNNREKYRVMFIATILIIWLSTSVKIFKSSDQLMETTTYKTIFFHDV